MRSKETTFGLRESTVRGGVDLSEAMDVSEGRDVKNRASLAEV